MDRLGNLQAFVSAAELNSFTQAAQRLGISPSAVGRRIAQLEEELGVRLFHRTTRAMRLTDEGRLLYARSRGALAELEEARAALSSLRERPAGRLRVELPTILGRNVLVPAMPRFMAQCPEVQLELLLCDRPADQVAAGIDVALRIGPLEDSSLIAKRIGRTRMCIYASPAYLEREGTPRTVAELSQHERIGFAPHGRPIPWRLQDGAATREIDPGCRLMVDDAQALVDLAVRGLGLAWACDYMVAEARASGRLVEVLEDSACEGQAVYVLSQPARDVLPKVRAFIGFATDALAHASGASGTRTL